MRFAEDLALNPADEAWLGPGSGLPAEMDSPGSVEFALKPRSAVLYGRRLEA